ncbi:MAG: glycosyltransferase, family 2 [Neobacillus sp.]|jgi:glycosyltransferase involved in cell wall biosynthesis|nr:glycosyltransferase, family 2 [Neobacillus sp.]
MPKISVLIPAYNHEKYIAETLQSILDQSLQDLEVIVVNDGSIDTTGKIIDEFCKKDPRVRAYHKENGGVVSALNFGMKHAQGEWLAWCGSDDIVPRNAYRDLLKNSGDRDVVIGEFSEIDDNGGKVRVRMQPWRKNDCFDALFSMPAMWSKIIRRRFVEENDLLFPDVLLCEDLIFLAKVAACRPLYTVIAKDIFHYRNNKKSASASMTHTYTLDYFKAHVEGRFKVLEITESAGIKNGRNYVFYDSIRYLSSYLPQMEEHDVDAAMEVLKRLLTLHDWKSELTYFEAVFGIPYSAFMEMTGREYVSYMRNVDSFDAVLNKFKSGDAGLQFVLQCMKGWLQYRLSSRSKEKDRGTR